MGGIVLENVCKSFGEVSIIKDINLEIQDGEFVVFVGPSGCGKSTLLRMITGLEEVSSGRVFIKGQDMTDEKPSSRSLAMVFQSYALFPHISVRDNISFGLRISKAPKELIEEKVSYAAKTLGLEKLLDRKPRELSGGQQQRVAIGRAIVRDPTAFMFDEPLSNLDAALRVQMRVELIRLHDSLKTTMVYVTHDQVEAMTMANRIVVLQAGRIEQFDTPVELYDRPVNKFVAGFIGSPKMNFVSAQPAADNQIRLVDGTLISVPGIAHEDMTSNMTVGIRPEHLEYSHEQGDWCGTIVVEEQLGSDAFLIVEIPGVGSVTVRAVGERNYHGGETIYLTLPRHRCHVFDNHDNRISPNLSTQCTGTVTALHSA
ncbi:ABC transporter ATP-binding protein [Motiliproteus sp. MSK22-1]|uniref:ABC transporter ATP-binding protein n=1 Tax=Motiliproteus sp. MSK22-1 TaxID=1897630 RepID=UPI00097763FC|nr:ABC transporter ATP-binding protein [Motiliproteus sp. MSK22-1]OMH38848.1 ABC transporter ATP-binding protein [Motiliproteus sp. MSK22-1]